MRKESLNEKTFNGISIHLRLCCSAGGVEPATSGPWDAQAMYYSGYHAARKKPCSCGAGKWYMFSSKCGSAERIEHVWDQLNSESYGSPIRYYK